MYGYRSAAPATPDPAERTGGVIRAAGSLLLSADGRSRHLITGDLLRIRPGEGFRIQVPADFDARADLERAAEIGTPVLLEWTDLSPTSVRDRVRARLRITARCTPAEPAVSADGDPVLSFPTELLQTVLTTPEATTGISPLELLAYALDRYGIVLRLRDPADRAPREVRLPFPRRLTHPYEVGDAIHELIDHHASRLRPL